MRVGLVKNQKDAYHCIVLDTSFIPFKQLPIRDLVVNETTRTEFIYHGLANLVTTEDTWEFEWKMGWTNCSASDNSTVFDNDDGPQAEDGFHRREYEPYRSLIYTTSKGGRRPNLTALSAGDDCGKT